MIKDFDPNKVYDYKEYPDDGVTSVEKLSSRVLLRITFSFVNAVTVA